MASTLEQSLRSILNQLNNEYEVVLVDDGSTDNSVTIISNLMEEYSQLRLIQLDRDNERKLGFTRNIGINEAKGKYILLQLDCDDVYGPYILDFVKIFHYLEKCLRRKFFLKGNKINISHRSFLLENGPYRNLFRGEDRDMWTRFAAIGAYIKLDHKPFVSRLPKPRIERIKRAVHYTFDHMQTDFRYGISVVEYYRKTKEKWPNRGFLNNLLRLMLLLPAKIGSLFKSKIDLPENMNTGKKFGYYREANRGSLQRLSEIYGCVPDPVSVSSDGRRVFF
jgi:glycosyltransferase involved in cell wall biosynthesis